jgi:membrane protease YdiL (CAAX protease family)
MMPTPTAIEQRETFAERHPVGCYFALAFAISWLGSLALVAPRLMRGQPVPKFTGLMMFPIMMLGPSVAGVVMTSIAEGRSGLRDLLSRMCRLRIPPAWYAGLLLPPAVMLCVLLGMTTFVSPVFSPNRFLAGIAFCVVAGFFEEIGWTGYVFPKMGREGNALASSISLGLLWAAWHLPVVDYLGTATPHGDYWFRYFMTFVAAMAAMRVLIAWMYTNTKSVLLAQLMHASSTGALVILSPPHVTASQEALWYAVYAIALWITVAIVVRAFGKSLTSSAQASRLFKLSTAERMPASRD